MFLYYFTYMDIISFRQLARDAPERAHAALWSPLFFNVSIVDSESIGELQGSRQPNMQKLEKYKLVIH